MWRNALIGDEGEAHAVESPTGDKSHVIHDERPVYGHRQGFLSFFKLPPVQARGPVAEVNASML